VALVSKLTDDHPLSLLLDSSSHYFFN